MKPLTDILRREPPRVMALIAGAALATGIVFALNASSAWDKADGRLGLILALSACAVAFQLVVVPLEQGAVSFASAPLMALGFLFGPAAAVPAAIACGLARLLASKGRVERAVFDCANLALASYVAAGLYQAFADQPLATRFLIAMVAGLAYWLVNSGLLSVAMSLSRGDIAPVDVFRQSFSWMAPYLVATGLLALGSVQADQQGDAAVIGSILPALLFALVARLWRANVKND